ncbi:MAG: protein translocase subunit SecF [Candidatus Magasanikbacteria bacterium]
MLNIVKNRNIFFIFSGVLLLVSLFAVITFGLKPGIDFTGGSLMEISFTSERPDLESMQAQFADGTYGSVLVQPTGENAYILKMRFISEDEHQEILANLRSEFENIMVDVMIDPEAVKDPNFVAVEDKFDAEKPENRLIEERLEVIGSSVSSQMKSRTFEAGIAVVIAIVLYITYAFRKVSKPIHSWKYGVTAVVALIHDVFITMGVFAFLGKYMGVEVDIPFVVALLTILGYSVNDTIIVFDRIRENLIKYGYDDFENIVNKGVNETISRSINTSFTTLLVLIALFFFGGSTIHYFVLALIIGISFGTYSSIFIASPLLVFWQKISKK